MPKKAASKRFRPPKRVREKGEETNVSELNEQPPVAPALSNNDDLLSPENIAANDDSSSTTASSVVSTPIVDDAAVNNIFSESDIAEMNVRDGSCSDSNDCGSGVQSEHSYSSSSCTTPDTLSSSSSQDGSLFSPPPPVPILSRSEQMSLLSEVNKKARLFLPNNWLSLETDVGINMLMLSRKEEKAIQRRVHYCIDGRISLSVHGKSVDIEPFLDGLCRPGYLHDGNVNSTVDFIVSVVNTVRSLEICSGADHKCRYYETLRVNTCKFLVKPSAWRCKECNKTCDRLRKKMPALSDENPKLTTANINLTKAQSLNKLKKQKKEIAAGRKKIERLQAKVQLLLDKEGAEVDDKTSKLMCQALESQDLSPVESLFLQQQLKAKQVKSANGMRWHPHMIRFALSVFYASPSAYNIILESGMMRLPSSRTLFDYSHVYDAEEGISVPVIESIHKKISQMPEKKYKWHVLLCDEMHICKNIVYHKRTGELMGYVKLSAVERDVQELQNYLDKVETKDPEQASKVLSFMVKGICNGFKEVFASFSMGSLKKEKLYSLTWKVISMLERSGIQVIAMTSDGNAVNRGFYKMNTPIHATKSGIVYDTINKAAPSRPLFFLSDLPHLIKTIRNNFYNSRVAKKSRRCLTKNGQKILWSTIIRLFNEKKGKTLRKSYKLNLANVFPNAYSIMNVGYAFQVMSKTVALDIAAQGWPDTNETVNFILKVNDFADCLNGAHSLSGVKSANRLLDPYRQVNDPRFENVIFAFLDYLDEWKAEAEQVNNIFLSQSLNQTNAEDSFQSLHDIHEEEGLLSDSNPTELPAHKRLLCQQTREGIEITARGFIGAVKYLLQEGGLDFINARIFCQDPLEQFFSKQRAKGGGSSTPNLQKYFNNCRDISGNRSLGIVKRKGNTSVGRESVEVLNEPLPKRKRGFDLPT
ncbi:Transposable element P transposase [Frankliniella fusca]|uniref:Transposable element P transposase n=1 Tax=Frankliniella fusca TaxID=407009 RepID=A0AAE1HBY1_9NEOP|nr:Transposable element P transposase [Frankliniella fusca]